MANAQHLGLLRQGVDVWNAWRTEQPSVLPDLGQADLSGANLYAADLSGASALLKRVRTGMAPTFPPGTSRGFV